MNAHLDIGATMTEPLDQLPTVQVVAMAAFLAFTLGIVAGWCTALAMGAPWT